MVTHRSFARASVVRKPGSALDAGGGLRPSRRRRRPRGNRLQRALAVLGAALMVAGGLAGLSTVATAPAVAATPGPAGSALFGANVFQQGGQTLYAYVDAGDRISASFTLRNAHTASRTFTLYRTDGTTVTCTIPAGSLSCSLPTQTASTATAGVWTLDWTVPIGAPGSGALTWSVSVIPDGQAQPERGRVFSSQYSLAQVLRGVTDFSLWHVDELGYLYQSTWRGYDGVNSVIATNGVGLVEDGDCNRPIMGSVEGGRSMPDCSRFLQFQADPRGAGLPESAPRWNPATNSTETMWVLPPVQVPEVTDIRLDHDDATLWSGAILADVDGYTGQAEFTIRDEAGEVLRTFTGPVTEGASRTPFDGLDDDGDPIVAQRIRIEVSLGRAGEIHFPMLDVEELSGGLEVRALTGPNAGSPNEATLYWDDSALIASRTPDDPGCRPSPIVNLDGVDSTGGVHGWAWQGCGTANEAASHPWGDQRTLDNWTYQNLDFEALSELIVPNSPEPWTCDAFGYLFQSPSGGVHQVIRVDLATGDDRVIGSLPANVNAVGYNRLDGFFYGWSDGGIVRINPDFTFTRIGPAPGAPASVVVGDIDDDGHYWATTGGPGSWVEVDLAPGSPTYGQVLRTGTRNAAGLVGSADWTWIDGALYSVGMTSMTTAVQPRLIRFTPETGDVDLGPLPVTTTGGYGATYADADGYLYAGNNTSGEILRIDPVTRDTIIAAEGPPSNFNDGARCASAPIPTLTVVKQVDGRLQPVDQFTVGIQNAAGDVLATATTEGAEETAATIDWPVSQTAVYRITDAMAAGAGSELADYAATIACVASDGSTPSVTGTAPLWNLTIDSAADYTCTVTNSGVPAPSISIVKSATPSDADSYTEGQEIEYRFVVTNTGNVPLTDVTVDEQAFTGTGGSPEIMCPAAEAAELLPGEQMVCGASYLLTQEDVNAGSVTNSATATGVPPTGDPIESPPSEVTIPVDPAPGVSLVKSATPTQVAAAGETVTYRFVVTNTGNVTLTDVAVDETAFDGAGDVSEIVCPETTLIPGQQTTCLATYTVEQADVDAGAVTNTAVAFGTPPTGDGVESVPSEAEFTASRVAGMTVQKSASPAGPASLTAGQEIAYSFLVTNTGNVTLTDVAVTELEFTGEGDLSDVVCPATTLAPGATMTCTATYTLTQGDVDGGSVRNRAGGTGTPPEEVPPPSVPPSEVIVTIDPDPAISVAKSADPEEAARAGDTITYRFVVTNEGNVTLTDVRVTETSFTGTGELSPIACPAGAASLAPGDSITCAASYELTQDDVDAGGVTNTATGTGVPPTGVPPVSPPSTSTVTVPPEPALTVLKSAEPVSEDEFRAGELITYTFVITNTGNVTLSDVTVEDGEFTGTGDLSPIECDAAAASLAPGAQATCQATYRLTQADVDSGSVRNTATATGNPPPGSPPGSPPPTSPPSEVEIPTPSNPSLSLVKSANAPAPAAAGDTVDYLFTVTNTGNVTLDEITVTETEFTGTGASPTIDCPTGPLLPGQSRTCVAVYTLTQEDVDAGSVTNTATATGTPPSGPPVETPPSTAIVDLPPAPALALVKSASPVTSEEYTEGQEITYSFVITNTGNVTLTDVAVTEEAFSGQNPLPAPTCGPEAASLAPGEQVVCQTTYVLTLEDVEAEQLVNTATSTGMPPGGGTPPQSPPSTVELPTPAQPALSLVKTADADVLLQAGQVIEYRFAITNTGNVSVADVTIDEIAFSGTGELSDIACGPAAERLLPGQIVACTATYEVTQDDIDAGRLENTALATGTAPGDSRVDSNESSVDMLRGTPGSIDLLKEAIVVDVDGNGITNAGDQVIWRFGVINSGVTTLNGIEVDDPRAGDVECPTTTLPPGGAMTCESAPQRITEADAARGRIENTATATGLVPDGSTVTSDPATAVVEVDELPLATTGSDLAGLLAGGGAIAVAVGLGLLAASRLRRHPSTVPTG